MGITFYVMVSSFSAKFWALLCSLSEDDWIGSGEWGLCVAQVDSHWVAAHQCISAQFNTASSDSSEQLRCQGVDGLHVYWRSV